MNRYDSDTEFYEATWNKSFSAELEDLKKERECATDHLIVLRDILYGKKPFDKDLINECMSELECYLDIQGGEDYNDLKIKGE